MTMYSVLNPNYKKRNYKEKVNCKMCGNNCYSDESKTQRICGMCAKALNQPTVGVQFNYQKPDG